MPAQPMTDTPELRSAVERDLPAIVSIWRESRALHADRDPSFTPRLDSHETFGCFVAARIADVAQPLRRRAAPDRTPVRDNAAPFDGMETAPRCRPAGASDEGNSD